MFTRFKRETQRVFLDAFAREKLEYEIGKKLTLILSPALYWVKKVKLPVKSVREAKALLPSLFEDELLAGEYSYYAYKTGEEFVLFAYEDKKILSLLQEREIAIADIDSIHFAQSEFEEFEGAIAVNEKQALKWQNGLLTLVPLGWIETHEALNLEALTLSSYTIKLQQFNHIVKSSSMVKIAALLVALIAVLAVETYIASAKKDAVALAREEIFSKYKLQSTMMQNESALKKYAKIHTQQNSLRKQIGEFLKLSLRKGETLTLIEFKNEKLFVTLEGISTSRYGTLVDELKKKGIKHTAKQNSERMTLEVKL